MPEQLAINATDKLGKYRELLPQIKILLSEEPDIIANMANLCAVLKYNFDWLWVGFYRVDGNELVLGPFQGPLACSRIPYARGVCGECWRLGKTIIVDDVDTFQDHIACSSLSKSEIVIPVKSDTGEIIAVLDIDSEYLANFDQIDQEYLTKIVELL